MGSCTCNTENPYLKMLLTFLVLLQAALVYETTAVCTYSAGQRTPLTKHVRLEGIGECLSKLFNNIKGKKSVYQ